MEHFTHAIKNYATFTGRATRQQYWMFILFYLLIYIGLTILEMAVGLYDIETQMGLLTTIYSLGLLIPSLAILARRLHDIGRSGWWILLIVIPLIGVIVLIVFALIDSEKEENQWGASPKYPVELTEA